MKKFRLFIINLLCFCLFKLTIINCVSERKFSTIFSKQSEKSHYGLRNKLMTNLGLNPADLERTERFAQLSEKLPHFVPDFMRSLFDKYRFELFNLSLEIEGKNKYLGAIEMIQSHRLREIHTWHKAGIHKLIFKEYPVLGSALPFARELRLNKKLFPKMPIKKQKRTHRIIRILTIFDNRFQLIKKIIIKDSSFSKDGWISVDISKNTNDSVFYLKFLRVLKIINGNFKGINMKLPLTQTNEFYSYYANIISFFRQNSKPIYKDKKLNEVVNKQIQRKSRYKRNMSHYLIDHNADCQRHPLVVTFKEVGWSKWIIAPQNYNAYYCKGNCPYPLSDNFNATNHAIIQLLVHGLKDVSVPKPCCVPYQLTPETLLYLNNEGDALLREFKDMSVNSCSCR